MGKSGKLLIVAGDTDGNLGDRAIVLSMCEAFRKLRPDIEIAIMSGNPERDRKFFPTISLIRRGPRGLLPLIGYAWTSDLVLCGGGGLFQDDDSLAKMPYWAARLMLLRLCCRRIIGYSIGAGPLRSKLGRFCGRLAFACMETITVRDPEALASCRGLTSKTITVLPDPALLTPVATAALGFLKANGVPVGEGPIVGVALRRWFHHCENAWIPHKYAHKYRLRSIPDKPDYHRLTTLIAEVLDELTVAYGAYVVLMPTYNVDHESDDRTCRAVLGKMRSRRATILEIDDPRLYKAVTAHLAVMLGGRLHPNILAAGVGTPVVGLTYNQKFRGFFNMLGMDEQILDVEAFVRQEKTEALLALLADAIGRRDAAVDLRVRQLSAEIHSFNKSLLPPAPK